jgi:hypothetical protein
MAMENQMTCIQTKAIEPQNRVIQSAFDLPTIVGLRGALEIGNGLYILPREVLHSLWMVIGIVR